MPTVEEKPRSEVTETPASRMYGVTFIEPPSSTRAREDITIVSYFEDSLDVTGKLVRRIDETQPNDVGPPSFLIEQLSGYQQLPVDWDGHGGVPTTRKAAASARRILELVEAFTDNLGMELSVDPLSNGGLDLEWVSCAENQLLVEIQPLGGDSSYSVCKKNRSDGNLTYWADRVYDLDEVLALLLWLDR